MANAAAPHSTASICSTVGTRARRSRQWRGSKRHVMSVTLPG